MNKLNAISSISMMKSFVMWQVVRTNKPLVLTNVPQANDKFTRRFTVDGVVIAEERNMTSVMLAVHWTVRHKGDKCYILEAPFADHCRDDEWRRTVEYTRIAQFNRVANKRSTMPNSTFAMVYGTGGKLK